MLNDQIEESSLKKRKKKYEVIFFIILVFKNEEKIPKDLYFFDTLSLFMHGFFFCNIELRPPLLSSSQLG